VQHEFYVEVTDQVTVHNFCNGIVLLPRRTTRLAFPAALAVQSNQSTCSSTVIGESLCVCSCTPATSE
jgi:hypothetical protein